MTNWENPRYMSDYPFISSYNDCQRFIALAKDPEKGRGINPSSSLWLKPEGKNFVVTKRGEKVCTFGPKNTITIHQWMYLFGANYYLPFYSGSNGRRVHRINVRMSRNGRAWINRVNDPLAFEGIRFDLNTGRCLNPKVEPPVIEPERNPVRYKKYLAALEMARSSVAAQQRLGFFDPNIPNTNTWYYKSYNCPDPIVAAAELKSGDMPKVMTAVASRIRVYTTYDYRSQTRTIPDNAAKRALKSVIDQIGRRDLKKHFGVYSQNKAR